MKSWMSGWIVVHFAPLLSQIAAAHVGSSTEYAACSCIIPAGSDLGTATTSAIDICAADVY